MAIGIILTILIILCIQLFFNYFNMKKYRDIGYTKEEIRIIYENFSPDCRKIFLRNDCFHYLEVLLSSKNYQKEYLEQYIQYISRNSIDEKNINDAIFLVNLGITDSYSDSLVKIVKEPYFIKDRLKRYLNYMNSNHAEDTFKVVQFVNCNLDLDYYQNKADVNKKSLILVNSFYSLDQNYTTDLVLMDEKYSNYSDSKLNSEAYEHFKNLVDDAEKVGCHIRNNSSYRSYEHQQELYHQYVRDYGLYYAKKYVSLPGSSEHQTGYALDVGVDKKYGSSKFEDTKEFLWMKEHSYKYGFILRYTKEGQELFGYGYEPWHYRYVGVDAATYIQEHKITYEEYYAYFVE